MTLRTRFTDLVGCQHPIQLAPMGAVVTPDLLAAVTAAGATGMLPATLVPAPVLAGMLDEVKAKVAGPYGVNFLVPFVEDEAVEVAAANAKIVDFFHGQPDRRLVDRVHASGALAAWQVGTADAAVAARDAGCDFVIAKGVESGGRSDADVALLPLLTETLERVDCPVVAAGGIANARGVAAVLAAGADAARVGTRFIATRESGAHPVWVEALLRAGATQTVRSEDYAVMWPNESRASRVLRSAIDAASVLTDEFVGEMPAGPETMRIPRFSVPPPNRAATGKVEAMALYAGQGAGLVREVLPAADVVRELAEGAETLLRRWGG